MRHRTLSIAATSLLVWLAVVEGCSDSGGSKGSDLACSEDCGTCQKCADGQCQPAADGTGCLDGQCYDGSCCTGCWDGKQCATGDIPAVCGALGVVCEDCRESTGACIAQACQSACKLSNAAVGGAWVCAIHPSQLLYCWGSNAEGQLGVTGSKGSSAPLLVGHSNRWKQLAVGDTHSCGLVTTSDVWCWGSNTYGQLGVDGTAARGEPARVVGDIVFAQVAAGGSDTCAIDTQGRLYCWGKSAATQAPRQVGTASDWVLVDVGSYAICAIRGAGELYCWGAGTEPTRVGTASNFSKVAVGVTHSCATNAVGMLYCWGKNDFGQLGIGNSTDASSPTQVGDLAYRSVAVGAKHSCAVTASGELRCWGSNSVGQLGLSSGPSTTGALKPTAPNLTDEFDLVFSGGNVTCALAVSGKLYCFGDNASGALGIGSSDSTTKTKAVCVADDTRTETPDGGTSSVVCPNAVHCEIAACEEESCGEQGEVCRDGACVCPSGATRLGFCRSWNIHETLLERRRQERRWPHEDPLGFPIRWIHHLR